MADIKILDLTEATEVTETTDYIPVVDTSDTAQDVTGTTKRATVRKLLGDRVLPDTIVGTTETQTLTNKTLTSPVINTPTGDIVTPTGTQTLSGKTLTDPVINTGISGTAILDEDDMASNSNTKLATQQSIKAYVDSGKAGASYIGYSGNNTTTTSTSAVQVGSCQVIVTTKGGKLFCTGFAIMVVNSLTGSLCINVDGTNYAQCLTNSTTNVTLCPQAVISGLTVGSHTIKLMFYAQGGATATIPAYNAYGVSAIEL